MTNINEIINFAQTYINDWKTYHPLTKDTSSNQSNRIYSTKGILK